VSAPHVERGQTPPAADERTMLGPLDYTDERPDADFDDGEEADAATMFEAYQRAVERCRAVAAGVSLETVVGGGYSVRSKARSRRAATARVLLGERNSRGG
jgi:hypothetical protein